MYHVRLFGPVTIEIDGEPVRRLGSQKSLAMLAYLIVRKRAVSRLHLADLFWQDKSESAGRKNIRWALHNLSTLLPNSFISERESIQFSPAPNVSVDLLQFETLRHNEDFDSLALALDTYQGEFMEGFILDDCLDFEQWILQQRFAQQQQVVHIMESLMGYYARFNQSFHMRQMMNKILNLEPWREDIHRHLMRQYVQSGQRVSALKQFDICHEALATHLQIAPSPETVALYERIRSGLPLDDEDHASAAEAEVIVTQPKSVRQTLPTSPTPFIGRGSEVNDLSQLMIKDCRLLTLTGPGGMGKTRLAIEIARRLQPVFGDVLYFVPLVSVDTPTEIPTAVAQAMGYQFTTESDEITQLLNVLTDTPCLLIMDNFEHLINGVDLLHTLLSRAPTLQIIISSRIRTNLLTEHVHEMQGLVYTHNAQQPEADTEAILLFMYHVQRILTNHTISNDDWQAINQICELTQGVPLALELAASWVTSLTLSDIADELRQGIDFLGQNRIDIPERHRSMRATFEYTWGLLTPEEQLTAAQLAIFKWGCTRTAARAIADISLRTLSALIDKSLLRHDAQNGRYTMHELQREFALEKFAQLCDVLTNRERYTRYYANLLQQHEDALYSINLPETLDLLTAEINNIQQAWEWAIQARLWSVLDVAVLPLGRYYHVMGQFQRGETMFRAALEAITADKHAAHTQRLVIARVQQAYAAVLAELGKTQQAITTAETVIELGQSLHQSAQEAAGYLICGKAKWYEGDIHAAQAYLHKAQELVEHHHTPSNAYMKFDIMRMLGMVALRAGDYQIARAYFDTCLNNQDDLGDTYSKGQILRNLGAIYRNLGDYDLAEHYYQQARVVHQKIRNRQGESAALNGLGDIAFYRFNFIDALHYYHTGRQVSHDIGDKRGESIAINNIGSVLQSLGRYDEAIPYFEQAIQIKQTIDFQRGVAWSQLCLGLLQYQRGNLTKAIDLCQAGYDVFRTSGDSIGETFSLLYLAHIDVAFGHQTQAIEKYQTVITTRQEFKQPHLLLEAQAGLAAASHQQNQPSQALALVETILHHQQQHGDFYGAYEPFRIYLTCIKVLNSVQDPRADSLLREALQKLNTLASQIDNPTLRERFLSQVKAHDELRQMFQA